MIFRSSIAAALGVLFALGLLLVPLAAATSSAPTASPMTTALPEELSFNANNGIVLIHRNDSREDLAPAMIRPGPSGGWRLLRYFGIQWSPDGSKLLALRYQSPKRPGLSLVVMDAKGKVDRAITGLPRDGRWSPDSRSIAFIHRAPGAGRALYVASTDGWVTQVATHLQTRFDPVFSWSPDGTELAYAGERSTGLFVANINGSEAARSLPFESNGPNAQVGEVKWSPDGSLIAFTTFGDLASGHLFVVHPDGTALRQVATDTWDFAWSPDSRFFAISDGETVDVIRNDGAGRRMIAQCRCDLRGPGFGQSLAWSSDGTRIAYVSGRGNTVSTVKPDGSRATVVATQRARGQQGGWYPSSPLWRPSHAP